MNVSRTALIEKARAEWIKRLMDSTRRNNLLYFRDLKSGSLDMKGAKDGAILKLFNDERVPLKSLILSEDNNASVQSFRTITRKAQSNLDEKGLQTLFLAFGMATWPVEESVTSRPSTSQVGRSTGISKGDKVSGPDGQEGIVLSDLLEGKMLVGYQDGSQVNRDISGLTALETRPSLIRADPNRPPMAPVILLPIGFEVNKNDFALAVIFAAGPPQINLVLTHGLASKFSFSLDEENILRAGNIGEEFDPELSILELMRATTGLSGFEVISRSVLSNFSFQKLSMIRDLKEGTNQLESHDMVAALCGDQAARDSLGGKNASLSPSALDAIPAENEFSILDADSSQQVVIHNVAAGLDGVIQGPPGCGKSQTIANVISTLVAQGKRVLFVAEKRAALEAVYSRLDKNGLGHLALDLHGASISQKSVMAKIKSALEQIKYSTNSNYDDLHRRFEDRRQRMTSHANEMTQPYPPSGLSPFELQTKLIGMPADSQPKSRWRSQELTKLTSQARLEVHDLLTDAIPIHKLVLKTDPSPWNSAELADGSQVQSALDAANRLAQKSLPELQHKLASLSESIQIFGPKTVKETEKLTVLMSETLAFSKDWQYSVFDSSTDALDLSPVLKGNISTTWALMFQPKFRDARTRMSSCNKRAIKDIKILHDGAQSRDLIVKSWREFGTSVPDYESLSITPELQGALHLVANDLATLTKAIPEIGGLALEDLGACAMSLSNDISSAHSIPKVRLIQSRLEQLSVNKIIDEFKARNIEPSYWGDFFDFAYFASCLESIRSLSPHLAGFQGGSHDQYLAEFKSLDKERLNVAAARVCRSHAERAIAVMNAEQEQTGLIKHEAAKSRKHLPLRKLFSSSGDVLTAICPCWMSSPLNVSQLLPADNQYFDVVIFDEASQVLTEDAICSIMRGKRLVAAGDQHQLPPTTFFADGGDDGDAEDITNGFESLLDSMGAFIDHWFLGWHYRSKDERLIAFSNRWIYGDRLTTFPGLGRGRAVTYEKVDARSHDGDEESSSVEVSRVVEIILDHARDQIGRPLSEITTLGVIAMGIKHADRVQMALDKALKLRPELDGFFDPKLKEPFFIKNIERVQGDERDRIILTLGYSIGASRKFNHNLLGPIRGDGGYRRLNVAVTRARTEMTLVSSITYRDIRAEDPAPVLGEKGYGTHLFRSYLQFAESGGQILGDSGGTGVPMNAFEVDIFNALTARGIPMIPQFGSSRFRLDFAAKHPEREGEFVLAIEADGASYHSSATARDRDRIRQEQLENIGWQFHRIWSTEWFLRREQSVENAVSAWKLAVARANQSHDKRVDSSQMIGGLFGDVEQSTIEEALPELETPPQIIPSRLGPRPLVRFYPSQELADLIVWVRSDGLLRTDEELIDEVIPLLGKSRRGSQLVLAIQQAIRDANNRTQ